MNTLQNKLSGVTGSRRNSLKRTLLVRFKLVLCIVLLILAIGNQKIFGQGVGISEVSIVPDGTSILELRSTLRGFLAPRMTTAARLAIASPAQGLLVYDTSAKSFWYYDNGWKSIAAETLGASNQLLGMNAAGTANEYKTLYGTANQIYVTNGIGSITLSTPQDIHNGASPTFFGLTLTGLTPNSGVYTNNTNGLTSTPPSIGIIGYWNRTGTVLSPSTAGDAVTTSGNIYTTGGGAITSSGLLTGSAGATISGGIINLNNSSNFATNINTGTSTSNVTIGNSANSLYLPKFTIPGVLHNDATGLVSSSLVVNSDITNNSIDLTQKVTGVLPVLHGGTGLATFGGTNTVLYTSAPNVLTSVAASTAAGQFLQTTTAGGAPAWKTILDVGNGGTGLANITTNYLLYGNGTSPVNLLAPGSTTGAILTTTATGAPGWLTLNTLPATSGILQVRNGGTGYDNTYSNGQLLIGNSTGTLTRNALTGTVNQVYVTNGDGTITLALPQDIHTGAEPIFQGLTLNGLTASAGVYTDASKKLTSSPPASGTIGYWNRTGTVLSPSNAGDAVTTSGNISTTGTGTITSAGLLTGSAGAAISGGAVNINNNSNFATNINTGTSTGAVRIGGSSNTITLPAFTAAGVVHNDNTGLLSTSLIVNNDIAIGTIDLTSRVTNVLPIANGGTNSGAALSGSSIMVSDGTSIIQGAKGTNTTVLHGNASGVPTYSAVDLTQDVSGVLPIPNGGTGSNTQNWVDLTTNQTVSGIKTWNDLAIFNAGITALGGVVNLNNNSNNATNINTGSSTSNITIGGAGNSLYLPKFITAGVLHNDATGLVTSGPISLTTDMSGILPVPNGGTGVTTLNNHGVLIGQGTNPVAVTATGTSGQVLQSGGVAANPLYSTAIYPSTTTVNQILYSPSNDNITGLATANNGVLITSGTGVPSISSTLPNAVQNNITRLGTITSGVWNGSILRIAYGGTNSGTALSGSSIMVSDGTSIVQGAKGTTTTVLHGNASGVPTYGQVVTQDIADANVTLTKLGTSGVVDASKVYATDVAGVPILIPLSTFTSSNLPNGQIFIGDAANTAAGHFVSGDATLSNTGVMTIADNAVTYGKIQAVSTTSRLLGSSSTTTAIQEISLGSGLTLSGNTLTSDGLGGTVTSVGLSLPSFITVTNSPVTGSGVLTGTLASQLANTIFAAPDGSAGQPAFRTLVAADIPSLDWLKITSGKPTTLAGYGITDAALSTHNHTVDGLSNVTITGKANNDILQWNGSAWVNKTLTGAGIITSETDPIVKAINGIVKSNGTTISAAVAGTDYVVPNATITAGTNTKITYDIKGLITAGASAVLASADYAGQGTATAVLHGGGAGNPSWSHIVNADVDPAAGIVDTKLATISTAGKVSNSATTATSANTANTVVLRDASGNFSAGTITATLSGNATSATSATSATTAGIATNLSGGAGGSIPYQSGASTTAMLSNGIVGQVLTSNGTTLAPSWTSPTNGTVTSVGLALPSFITVTNSPVTGSGVLTGTLASQTANTVFAAPNGSAGSPTFRPLVAADIPNNAANTTGTATNVTGTVLIANGGTGQSTASAAFSALSPMTTLGDIIYGGASGAGTRLAGNITTTPEFLKQIGTGAVSAAPVWSVLGKADVGLSNVENTALSTWTGSANITTLGTIGTGTWNAGAITSSGAITGNTIVKSGGTASQFLKADGSIDANTYLTGNQSINFAPAAGDVTGSTSGTTSLTPTLTISNKAVTLAKMADMASGSLIYRKTAGAGSPEVQSLATLKTDLGLTGTNSGDLTLAAIGASPNGNGASLAAQVLTLQPADGSNGGVLTAAAQTIGGAKTWSNLGTFNSGLTATGGVINLNNDATVNGVNIGTGTNTGTVTIGNTLNKISLAGTILGGNPLVFEGATSNAFKTTFAITDPTAARTITFPDASGTVAFQSLGANWVVSGNAGTNPVNDFIGTTDNNDLVFRVNNTERARFVSTTGDIKIGDATSGTVRSTLELIMREDGDFWGSSILRLRNRNAENGAIFETVPSGGANLVDFIFRTSDGGSGTVQRNIRFEARALLAKTGAPSFHLGGTIPDVPTLSIGDEYAAFNKGVRIGNYPAGTVPIPAPTALLHLNAGTATAGTAPLKFTAGTNLTTPEDGAVEYDGTNYSVTNNTAKRYTLAKTLTNTATLDFISTGAQSNSDLNITVTGAALNDAVVLGIPNASITANSTFTAWVSSANTVTVRFNNYSSSAKDPSSGSFRVSVLQY